MRKSQIYFIKREAKMQSLEEHLAAMKRVRAYENRDFQRRVDQYDFTLNHLGLLLTCFPPRGDEMIFRVKQHLKSEFGNFAFQTWLNWVGKPATERRWNQWLRNNI